MVEGALEQPDLGLNEEDLRHVSDEVSVVFHTAATIKFDAPLRCVRLCVVCVCVVRACVRTYVRVCMCMCSVCIVLHIQGVTGS